MTAILPCPFCGATEVNQREGSTFRWLLTECAECEASSGEVRVNTLSNDRPAAIEDAKKRGIEEWNQRTPPQFNAPALNELGFNAPSPREFGQRITERLNAKWLKEVNALKAELVRVAKLMNDGIDERLALKAENTRFREALNDIASWGEGKEVSGRFDEPDSAQVARKALEAKP